MNYLNKIKSNVKEEYYPLINDITRILSILVVTNILMYLSNPKVNKIMSENYINLIVFIILGVLTYWLVIKNVIILN